MITSSSLELTIYSNIQQYTTKESSLIISVFVWPNFFHWFSVRCFFFHGKMATDSIRGLCRLWNFRIDLRSAPGHLLEKHPEHPMLSSTHEGPNMNLKPSNFRTFLDMDFLLAFPKIHTATRHMFFRRRPWQRVVKYKASNLRSHLGSYLARVG